MGKCLIFCAAEFDALAAPIAEDDFILAADGGLQHLQKLQLTPHGIIGDFDSLGYIPDGANEFVDAMCIPTCCQNKDLAEIFINYMLSPEPAIANAEYIWYASPNTAVVTDPGYQEDMGEEAMAILYPEMEDFAALYNKNAYRNLDAEHLEYLHSLWETLKIN